MAAYHVRPTAGTRPDRNLQSTGSFDVEQFVVEKWREVVRVMDLRDHIGAKDQVCLAAESRVPPSISPSECNR